MCFGGGRSQEAPQITMPTVTPAPEPAPIPSPTPTETESAQNAQQRRAKIAAMRSGILSTIKTSPQGITGTGANLVGSDSGKKTLGA